MKKITDAHNHRGDVDMTVEQIVARIRWLDETLKVLHGELAAAVNRNDPHSSAIFRIH